MLIICQNEIQINESFPKQNALVEENPDINRNSNVTNNDDNNKNQGICFKKE